MSDEDIVVVAKSWLDGAKIPYDEVYVSEFCNKHCGDLPRVCVRARGIAVCYSMKELAQAIQDYANRGGRVPPP